MGANNDVLDFIHENESILMKDMFGVEVFVGDKVYTTIGLCEILDIINNSEVIVKRHYLGCVEGIEFWCLLGNCVKMTPEQLHQCKSLELIRELANV